MTSANLLDLIQVLATAYAIVLGVTVLVSGWQFFRDRRSVRPWRGVLVFRWLPPCPSSKGPPNDWVCACAVRGRYLH